MTVRVRPGTQQEDIAERQCLFFCEKGKRSTNVLPRDPSARSAWPFGKEITINYPEIIFLQN